MADDRCRSKIAHESGAVLQCMEPRGHVGNHLTTREQWGDHHPDEIVESTGAHVYLSTGCLHGDHDYCQSTKQGSKIPAECKFCAAPCICPCHETGPATPASAGAPEAPPKSDLQYRNQCDEAGNCELVRDCPHYATCFELEDR